MKSRWQVVVEAVFTFPERGTIVAGSFEGVLYPHEPAIVTPPGGESFRLESVTYDMVCGPREAYDPTKIALLLGHVDSALVGPGTIVRSVDET